MTTAVPEVEQASDVFEDPSFYDATSFSQHRFS